MYACCALHFRAERLVFLHRARRLDIDGTDGIATLAVETQGNGAACLCSGSSHDGKLLSALRTEVHTAQTDLFVVVDVKDIHILLTR